MHQLEVTFGRAMKFWWSLTWRTGVLMLPITVVLNVMMVSAFMPEPGKPLDPADLGGMLLSLAPAYVVGMALSVVAMVYATRWALRTKWSDFRLLVVRPESGDPAE